MKQAKPLNRNAALVAKKLDIIPSTVPTRIKEIKNRDKISEKKTLKLKF